MSSTRSQPTGDKPGRILWKSLAQWMRAGGLGDAPRTLVEEFARIKSGDVVLPTRGVGDEPARTLRLRCVTTADDYQESS